MAEATLRQETRRDRGKTVGETAVNSLGTSELEWNSAHVLGRTMMSFGQFFHGEQLTELQVSVINFQSLSRLPVAGWSFDSVESASWVNSATRSLDAWMISSLGS